MVGQFGLMGILCEDFAFLEVQSWHSFEQSVKQEMMIAL